MLNRVLPARDLSQGEPRSTGCLDGSVYLHIDIEAYDFHIDTKPVFDREALAGLITQAEWWGMELMDEDECEPELLPDGGTRIYLTPIVPAEIVQPTKGMGGYYAYGLLGVLAGAPVVIELLGDYLGVM